MFLTCAKKKKMACRAKAHDFSHTFLYLSHLRNIALGGKYGIRFQWRITWSMRFVFLYDTATCPITKNVTEPRVVSNYIIKNTLKVCIGHPHRSKKDHYHILHLLHKSRSP